MGFKKLVGEIMGHYVVERAFVGAVRFFSRFFCPPIGVRSAPHIHFAIRG